MSWLKAKDWGTGVEYSSLFHSGLRAISRRRRSGAHRTRARSSGSSSLETGWSGGSSSIPPTSSHLLKRSTAGSRRPSPASSESIDSSPSPPPYTPQVTRPRLSSMLARQTKEMSDVWSSEGGLCEIGGCTEFPEEERHRAGYLMPSIEMDGIRSTTGSRPFFVNLGEVDATVVPPIEESFLSLSNDPDGFLHHPIPRYERPVSMQTMSLPSRCSSFVHHCTHETKGEWDDCGWMLEESDLELEEDELEDEGGGEERLGDVDERLDAVADWRQFHVDWLQAIR